MKGTKMTQIPEIPLTAWEDQSVNAVIPLAFTPAQVRALEWYANGRTDPHQAAKTVSPYRRVEAIAAVRSLVPGFLAEVLADLVKDFQDDLAAEGAPDPIPDQDTLDQAQDDPQAEGQDDPPKAKKAAKKKAAKKKAKKKSAS